MKKKYKYKRFIDYFFATCFVVGLIFFIRLLPDILEVFNPIERIFNEFDITDIAFSELHKDSFIDTNIVIVQIAKHYKIEQDRNAIANQIKTILKYNPKVIGIDAYFSDFRSEESDSSLKNILAESSCIVLSSLFVNDYNLPTLDNPTELIQSDEYFKSKNYQSGFINFYKDRSYRTVRTFYPEYKFNGSGYFAFPIHVVAQYKRNVLDIFLKRNKTVETINFKGNYSNYFLLSAEQLSDTTFDKSFLLGKIVLLGYLGESFLDEFSVLDKFYTPLNENHFGRALPDMFGVIVHANIISMILDGDYIYTFSEFSIIFWTIIICFLNIWFFQYIEGRFPFLYGEEIKIFIFIEILMIIFISIFLLIFFNIKFNITFLLVVVFFAPDFSEIYFSSIKKVFSKLFKRSKDEKVP